MLFTASLFPQSSGVAFGTAVNLLEVGDGVVCSECGAPRIPRKSAVVFCDTDLTSLGFG